MTCNCKSVCRIPDIETMDGKYPMPDHAPMCNEHRPIRRVASGWIYDFVPYNGYKGGIVFVPFDNSLQRISR